MTDLGPLEELKRKKLWHQLTEEILQYIDNHEEMDLTSLYETIVNGLFPYMNEMKWAKIVTTIAKTTPNPVSFLAKIRGTFDEQMKMNHLDSYLIITLSIAQHLQFTDEGTLEESSSSSTSSSTGFISMLKGRELADQLISEVTPLIEERIGYVNPTIHLSLEAPVEEPVVALYHLVIAEKCQLSHDFLGFYHHMLQYLSRTPMKQIKLKVQREIAKSLAVSAIVSPSLYTFGELASHPLFQSLKGTEDEWLHELVLIFDEGDSQKYKKFITEHDAVMRTQPILLEHSSVLRDKLRVASIVSYVFSLPVEKRVISFEDVQRVAQVSPAMVEFLVLKSFATGIITGRIDEIEKLVVITDIKPRMLSRFHVAQMEKKVTAWSERAADSLHFLQATMNSARN
ncbi:putative 19S proteasome regulatory subunit Rpn9 [Monocercomonoides exilis]|uniref:putative 19S proteasome regulatory subunit Rpn9 n=1 Tax=Monocercomonoides exilis TaxID=2049356 RepID=UPI0035599F8D|nr:putative 19S proteasome regulatory subunit Rpn9 [Monocercomonoides exilis]|eukprot:MONOS_4001.1-p1 / transcript=MONOS_4001.1 / gene=MONOS_4001 / organism=Monocercomonoides_exilis_PA203 / gene_product=19S proteasome regulatory subunit Rpn9 / transcript_product=19S proteasome regulatory subunit Rpn9 / location=Mono_scaffold00100:98128-100571(+) / protein_length=399 / sequence_SO=supercontig / SO=protein_coding / is_pseudo=false